MQVTLVEIGTQAMFCQHMIELLKLDGVDVVNSHAETLGQDAAHTRKI